MRKFLALVLAMLMVSASALSVSAAFADQDAVDAHDYAEAIEELYDLGVIAGKEDASGKVAFDAEGTLTREEAAVVAAKLIAGSKQTFDWSAATTCRFTDVTAKWSFGYIEFAADRGVLDGIGGGKFNPKGTLSVAEAVALVVKASGLRSEVAALDFIQKPTTWYLNWIEVAEDNDLLTDVNPFSYTQSCSRATMAQLASNALAMDNGNNKLANGFANQKTTVVGNITKVTADGVVIGTSTFNTAAFNAALEGVTADQLIDCKVEVKYNPVTNKITDIDVLTSTLALDYKNGKIAVVKEKNANTNKITLDGATYVVAAAAGSNTGATGGIGGGTTTTNSITVTVDGETLLNGAACKNLPTYYAGIAYDDNNDGLYDRVALDSYRLAVVTKNKGGYQALHNETKDKYVAAYEIKFLDDNSVVANTATITTEGAFKGWGGATHVVSVVNPDLGAEDAKTPALVNFKKSAEGTTKVAGTATLAFLGKATTVAGVLESYSPSGNYVMIAGEKYGYVYGDATADPATWTLKQTVSAYVFEGKYIGVTADFSSEFAVWVDSVSINEDGKAVVKGFKNEGGYADITVTVDGIAADKLVNKSAIYNWADWTKKTGAFSAVVIGDLKADGTGIKTTDVTFIEGGRYFFVKTTDGIYVDLSQGLADTDKGTNTATWTFGSTWKANSSKWEAWGVNNHSRYLNVNAVKDGYVWLDCAQSHWNQNKTHVEMMGANGCDIIPAFFTTSNVVVFTEQLAAKKGDNPYDYVTYAKANSLDFGNYCAPINISAKNGTALGAPVKLDDYSAWVGKDWATVERVFVPAASIPNAKGSVTTLAANTGIAQIVEAFETGYDTTKYYAIDLFTGVKIELVSDKTNLTAKAFYEYDTTNMTVKAETLWVDNFVVNVAKDGSGLTISNKITAKAVKLTEQNAGQGDYKAEQYGEAVTFKNIIVYKTASGLLSLKDGKVETLKTTDIVNGTNLCYIMGDTLIVIK